MSKAGQIIGGDWGRGARVFVGEWAFALVKLGAGEEAAAIIPQVEHGERNCGGRKPGMGRGVERPEFADLRALPAAHRSQDAFGRDGMGEVVFDGPTADLGAVQFAGVEAAGLRKRRSSRDTTASRPIVFSGGPRPVAARRGHDRHRKRRASRGTPVFPGARGVVSGGQSVEAAAGEAERAGGFRGRQSILPESFEHLANERGGVAMEQLLIFFKDGAYPRAALGICPALLAPRHLATKSD